MPTALGAVGCARGAKQAPMPMTQGAIDTPTAEQAVDCALANDHAVHDVDDVALEVDDDVALDGASRPNTPSW